MSPDTGITVSGGGTTAVSTPSMQKAAAVLATATDRLHRLRARVLSLRFEVPSISPADNALGVAEERLDAAVADVERTALGLAIAAQRYGVAEEAATTGFRDVVALEAGAIGTVVAAVHATGGPDAAPAAAAFIALQGLTAVVAAGVTAPLRAPRGFDPFADPVLVGIEGRGIASVDDLVRGEHGEETLAAALGTDSAAPDSTQRIAASAAARVRDDPGFTVTESVVVAQETPRPLRLPAPRDLAGVGALVPDDGDGRPQVRITEVAGSDGVRRWIVAVAGTTTFDPRDTDQVFDMRSNLQGVGGVPMDSERTTEEAMRTAGVRPGDPVLVVGHSQGALVAMRLAQSGRFDVEDVVTLGGPTRPVVAPARVHVLAVEHTDDPVPGTGGAAPDGPGPANRVLVRRAVYAVQTPTAIQGDTWLAPAHLPSNYVATLADVDASSDPRLVAFTRRVRPFLSGSAVSEQLYRADRGQPPAPVPPGPLLRPVSEPLGVLITRYQREAAVSAAPPDAPTAGAAAAPRPSR